MAVIERVVEVHLSTIMHGDTIICSDGKERTVSKEFIKRCQFLGTTLYGDSYRLGTIPVKKIIYEKI